MGNSSCCCDKSVVGDSDQNVDDSGGQKVDDSGGQKVDDSGGQKVDDNSGHADMNDKEQQAPHKIRPTELVEDDDLPPVEDTPIVKREPPAITGGGGTVLPADGDADRPKTLALITNNKIKAKEHIAIAKGSGIDLDLDEDWIRGLALPVMTKEDPADVVKEKAIAAFNAFREEHKYERPVLVEDLGLHFRALDGFPGANICIFHDKFEGQEEKIASVLDPYPDKRATFKSACAICWRDQETKQLKTEVFVGTLDGDIVPPRRKTFQSDSIFVPLGETKTLAEMGEAKKREIFTRKKLWDQISVWATYAGNSAMFRRVRNVRS